MSSTKRYKRAVVLQPKAGLDYSSLMRFADVVMFLIPSDLTAWEDIRRAVRSALTAIQPDDLIVLGGRTPTVYAVVSALVRDRAPNDFAVWSEGSYVIVNPFEPDENP